jgi:hypothetical protein
MFTIKEVGALKKLVALSDFLDKDNHFKEADSIDKIIKSAFIDISFFNDSVKILNEGNTLNRLFEKYCL